MEIHHHAHTARKKWTHYLWEFLMLFLAVFCGFLAEYKLEQTIERHREKEFIISMMEDARTDTANIHTIILENETRANYLDSLAEDCYRYEGTQEQTDRLYLLVRRTLYRPDLLYPTDRTIFQLKNAAGMRLIRKKKAATAIIEYDNSGKQVINQQVYYENYLTDLTATSILLIDFRDLWSVDHNTTKKYTHTKLISEDRQLLLKMGNLARIFEGILKMYIIRLREMEEQAVKMTGILQAAYHLE